MTSVQEVTPAMFEEVYPLLQQFNRNNPQIIRNHWELLFKQPWNNPGDTLGYVLVDNGKIVGYLGAICSHRMINGREEACCNLTSWVVAKEHRQKAALLFMPVLKLKDYTTTILTPAKHVHAFYKRMGFCDLERQLKVIYPIPQLKRMLSMSGFRGTTDPQKIEKILHGADLQIFRDHRPFHCKHLVLYRGEEYCYVIFARTKGRKIHFTEIHYASEPQILLENLDCARFHFFKESRTLFILVQGRLLQDVNVPHCKTSVYTAPPLYRSTHLTPQQIDNLYSEMMLLPL